MHKADAVTVVLSVCLFLLNNKTGLPDLGDTAVHCVKCLNQDGGEKISLNTHTHTERERERVCVYMCVCERERECV